MFFKTKVFMFDFMHFHFISFGFVPPFFFLARELLSDKKKLENEDDMYTLFNYVRGAVAKCYFISKCYFNDGHKQASPDDWKVCGVAFSFCGAFFASRAGLCGGEKLGVNHSVFFVRFGCN